MNADVYTQTHKHAHRGRSSSCRKHLERSDAHMSTSLYAVFAFLRRHYISRKTNSFNRPPDAKTHIWLRFLSVLASSSSVAGLSSVSVSSRKDQLPWIQTRRKHRISILSCTQWTTSEANDLLTYWTAQDTPHNCFLSYKIFSSGLITGWTVVQALVTSSFHIQYPDSLWELLTLPFFNTVTGLL